MNTYSVAYDLFKPGQNYDGLIAAIKKLGPAIRILRSHWVVRSTKSATQVRDTLKSHIDSGDKLIVIRWEGEAAWWGFPQDVTRKIKETV